MIKYLTNYRCSCIQYNTETDEINDLGHLTTGIDWIYRIPEDGEFNMAGKKAIVKKDDIIVKFYQSMYEPFIVVSSPEWIEALENAKKRDEEEKVKCLNKYVCNERCEAACEAACAA